MKKSVWSLFVTFLTLVSVSSATQAQQRPDSRTFYCDEARAFVKSKGAVVMSTGRFTYERVVSSRNFCELDEDAFKQFAPTRDRRKCPIGLRCVPGFVLNGDG